MVDQLNDVNGNFIKDFLQKNPDFIPKLEKVAELEEEVDYDNISSEAFADKENRMFPLFPKTAAVLSSIYIAAQKDQIPDDVIERAQEALNMYGITDIDIKSFQKTASLEDANVEYLFPEEKKLPLTKESYRISEYGFSKIASQLDLRTQIIKARKLVKTASELGIEPDETIVKMSLIHGVSLEKIAELAKERFYTTGDGRYLDLLDVTNKTASLAANQIFNDLLMLDLENNIKDDDILIKVAADEKKDYVYIDKIEIPYEKIANIPQDEWTDVLDHKTIDYIFNGDKLNKENFEKVANNMTDLEKDILIGFIQKYL